MNKNITKPDTPSFLADRSSEADDLSHCVIVLIPDGSYNTVITRRVWEIANETGAHVQLLSLCEDVTQEPGLRRRLIVMAALLHHDSVTADWNIQMGTNWVETVKQNSHPEDLIVCFAEQRAGLLHRPLCQILQSNLKNPVYILTGLSPRNLQQPGWFTQSLSWCGSLVILAAAFLLQIQIVSTSAGWLQTTLLMISVIAEALLIAVWNNLFG